MVDSCDLNPLKCLNNGKCAVNISSNTTYCQCDPCYEGILCGSHLAAETQFDSTYPFVILSFIGLGLSVLNNGLIFELFICCKRIRRTNCGIYLLVYSILSLISSILLVALEVQTYYPNSLKNNPEQNQIFYCYVGKIGYNMFIYLCIWFNAFIAFERGLIIRFDFKMNANRWRSIVTSLIMFIIAGGSAAPLLWCKCEWDNIPPLQTLHVFFVWFYIVTGLVIYLVATLLVLISFARRIRRYGMRKNVSYIKTFLKLLYTHLFIFIPPIAYIISEIPYTIVVNTESPGNEYFQCGISTGEFVVKVLIDGLTGLPVVITWLLFVYPSKVYMTEFYLNTWSGRSLANILLLFKSYNGRKKNAHLPTTNLTNNEHDNRESEVESVRVLKPSRIESNRTNRRFNEFRIESNRIESF